MTRHLRCAWCGGRVYRTPVGITFHVDPTDHGPVVAWTTERAIDQYEPKHMEAAS